MYDLEQDSLAMGIEVDHPLSARYIAAAGDSMAFRRVSNISDLALAAAECAAALERETDAAAVAVTAANAFFHNVRHNIVFDDCGGPIEHIVMGYEGGDWAPRHSTNLRQAEESYRLLELHDLPSRNDGFHEWLGRLKQKITDGQYLEALP